MVQRSDMGDESKLFISDKHGKNSAVKAKTKKELKHLSSQSWLKLTLVSDYAAANRLFHPSKHH